MIVGLESLWKGLRFHARQLNKTPRKVALQYYK